MKKSSIIIKSLIFLAVAGLMYVTGCKKDNNNTTTTTTTDYTAATDNSEAEISANDVLNVSDAVVNDYTSSKSNKDTIKFKWNCANVTKIKLANGSKFERKIIIDFGTTDLTCFGLKTRRGQIILWLTGRYYFKGFEDSITFNNYYVNDKGISNTSWHVVKNIGQQNGNLTWTVNVNLTITRQDGAYHTWISTRQRELLNVALADTATTGWATNLPYVYQITGSAYGVNSKGVSYTATIVIPLIKAFDCWWIEKGSINFQIKGYTIVLDYGDGTCDDQATVTFNSKTYNITLP